MIAQINRLPPGARHALLGLAIQAVSAVVIGGLLSLGLPRGAGLLAAGGWCAVVFFASRERRQAEEAAAAGFTIRNR